MFQYIFYGICIVGAITLVVITVLRIDWARHPEKYADAVKEHDADENQKAAYRAKKEADRQKALKKTQDKEKAAKKQKRIDAVNRIRQKNSDKAIVAHDLKQAGITPEKSPVKKEKK